jgi:hypothetical protein
VRKKRKIIKKGIKRGEMRTNHDFWCREKRNEAERTAEQTGSEASDKAGTANTI